jgi:hypothetical protein
MMVDSVLVYLGLARGLCLAAVAHLARASGKLRAEGKALLS